ncbi:MAG: tetratricopeptide repeat protein [Campylobacterota bacterium]|nr:tetratricopeptide repeat protein [Campylobacterota bacterium]
MKFISVFFLLNISLFAVSFDEAAMQFHQKNYTTAFKSFEALALKGDPNAQYNVALMLTKGYDNIAKNHKQSFKWYKKAALLGHKESQNNLATIYFNGDHVTKDLNKALQWYKKSAQQGYVLAKFNLAIIYERNINVKNIPQAMKLFKQSADLGYVHANVHLADIYREGRSAHQDYNKSFIYYFAALEQNSAKAMYFVGLFYFYGYGVIGDKNKAKFWMKEAQKLKYKRAGIFLFNHRDEFNRAITL